MGTQGPAAGGTGYLLQAIVPPREMTEKRLGAVAYVGYLRDSVGNQSTVSAHFLSAKSLQPAIAATALRFRRQQ